jgi:hypothetical protein
MPPGWGVKSTTTIDDEGDRQLPSWLVICRGVGVQGVLSSAAHLSPDKSWLPTLWSDPILADAYSQKDVVHTERQHLT